MIGSKKADRKRELRGSERDGRGAERDGRKGGGWHEAKLCWKL